MYLLALQGPFLVRLITFLGRRTRVGLVHHKNTIFVVTLLKHIFDGKITSHPGKIRKFLYVSFFIGGVGCGSPFERTMSGLQWSPVVKF